MCILYPLYGFGIIYGVIYMAITKAQQKATAKYIKNNYDEIKTRVPKGRKAEIQAHAEKQGKSLNAFVNEAIDEKIERDNAEDNQ